MFTLKLKHHFVASHQLRNAYAKECNTSLHGHNWEVEVEIRATHLIDGMIIDFKKLKAIIDELDHITLLENTERNGKLFDVLYEMGNKVKLLEFEPTAENLTEFLQREISKEVLKRYELEEKDLIGVRERPIYVAVTVWEAEKASIRYEDYGFPH